MDRQSKRLEERDERDDERRADAATIDREIRRPRATPGEYLREVRTELRKVAWPNREEVVSYTVVVIVATAFLMSLVFGMDWVIGRLVFAIFGS